MRKLFTLIAMSAGIATSAQSIDKVQLLFNWDDTTLVGSTAFDNTYNEIWGYAADSREYAIIGSTAGTHFFDVTDPANSVQVDFVPGDAQGGAIIHRDYHDYNGYLYAVSDEGASTLQIMDMQYLPDSVHVVYNSDTLIRRSHNIFIDTANARLYACGVSTPTRGFVRMSIASLANPEIPTLLADVGSTIFPESTHDVYVRDNVAYVNDGNSGLFIVDFTDVNNPNVLGTLINYPYKGYNHSGWLSDDGNTYFFADENGGARMKSLDVSDMNNLTVLDTFFSNVDPINSIPHNQVVKGNFLYVGHYHDGLYIFDVSDPSNVNAVGHYDTYLPPDHFSFKGAWGVYPFLPSGIVLVSDMQTGLYIFDVSQAISVEEQNIVTNLVNPFPNPFNDKIEVEFSSSVKDELKKIELLNNLGQVIFSTETNAERYTFTNTEFLAKGVYILRATVGNNQSINKLIKAQ